MRFIKTLKSVPWKYKYIIILCVGLLVVSIIYPKAEEYAMAHRMSSAHGGEVLLWAIPFLIIFIIWAHRYEK